MVNATVGEKEKQIINNRKNKWRGIEEIENRPRYEETIYGGVFHKITMPHQPDSGPFLSDTLLNNLNYAISVCVFAIVRERTCVFFKKNLKSGVFQNPNPKCGGILPFSRRR
jgi:hypothetical protein